MNVAHTLKIIGAGALLSVASYVAPVAVEKTLRLYGADISLVAYADAQAAKKKTRKLPGISEKTMKQLGKISELVSPDTEKKPNAKPNYPEALKELRRMERSCKDKCNKYELSQIYRFYAFAYFSMDNTDKAIESYQKVVAQSPEIPIAVELDALYALAQLLWSKDRYDQSLKYLNDWMGLSTIIGADIYFFRGTVHYSKNDKASAIKDVDRAIAMKEEGGGIAKEQWYGLQRALYLEREDYRTAKKILEKLVVNYPKIEYWTQLANVNGLLERELDQMHALDTVYIQGKLEKRQNIVNMAYLYLGNDVPYKAAKVLEEGMEKKYVDRNVRYLKVLAGAWRQAKEPEKAVKVLNEAAKVAVKEDAAKKNDRKYRPELGDIYAELVGLHLNLDNSKSAVDAGKKALRAGNLRRACDVHTNMGIAYVDMAQFKSAISAFDKAAEDKQCRAMVLNWRRYAENEQRQKEELAKAI